MAQTKRKRQTKHRGNAAGVIEARGRTGRPLTGDEKKKQSRADAREERLTRKPTWKRSFQLAAFVGPIMFAFLLFTDHAKKGSSPVVGAALFALLAVVIYTPGGYYMEMFLWRRRMAKKQQQPRSK